LRGVFDNHRERERRHEEEICGWTIVSSEPERADGVFLSLAVALA